MSKNEIMRAASEMISFIKERAKIDVSTACLQGMVDIKKEDAQKLGNIVVSSIEANFIKAASNFERSIEE